MENTVSGRTAPEKKYYTVGVLTKAFSVIEIMSRESKWELGRLAASAGMSCLGKL